jgi:hypothetical protein
MDGAAGKDTTRLPDWNRTRPAPVNLIAVSGGLERELGPQLAWLERLDITCLIATDMAVALRECPPAVAFVSAFTEAQGRRLRELADAYPAVAIIAVVRDLTGHDTHRAIECGARLVVNLVIPDQARTRMMMATVSLHGLGPVPGPPVPGPDGAGDEAALVELLRGTLTLGEIAHRLHCSERSLYRRLRPLYASLGVRSRHELQGTVRPPAATARDPR